MKQNKGKQFARIIERPETPEAIKNMMLHLFTDAQNNSGINDRHPDFLKGTFNVLANDHKGNINNDFDSLEKAIEIELRERPLPADSEMKKFMKIVKSWEPVMYIHPKLLAAHIQVVIDDPKVSDGAKEVLEMQINRMADWAGMSWTASETIEHYLPVVVKELINKNGAKETASDLRLLAYLLEGRNGFTWKQYEERELAKINNKPFFLKAAAIISSNKDADKASKVFAIFVQMYPSVFDEETVKKMVELTGIEPHRTGTEDAPLDLSEIPAPSENDCIDLARHLSAVLKSPHCPDKLHEVISDQIGCLDQPKELFTSPEYLAQVLCANDEVSE